MIPWREKWRAFAFHFAATLALAAGAAAIIFGLWFPDPFDKMVGGQELFLLVVGCDLALGPLISLVIYDSGKSRRKLIFDYSVVGLLQVAALVYGVWVVAGSRPVYVTFVGDRFDVVTARDFRPAELAAARDPIYRALPWTGPELVGVRVPPEEKSDALFQALDGNEESSRPRFYVPFESLLDAVRAHALTLAVLEQRHPEAARQIAAARAGTDVPAERLRFLPVKSVGIFWTALIDLDTGKPVKYFALDPY